MDNQKTLSASNIRYLLTMKELDKSGKGIRCIDIAAALKLSKPSVHNMMNTFMEMGLVIKEAYGIVIFTDIGRYTAQQYSRYYNLVADILKNNFPKLKNVRMATCSLLSEIPEGSLEELCSKKAE